jgi:hypothetical protein
LRIDPAKLKLAFEALTERDHRLAADQFFISARRTGMFLSPIK